MSGPREIIVGGPAVMDHDAVVVTTKEILGHGPAAVRSNDVDGCVRCHQRMQPGRPAALTPSRLVQDNPFGLGQSLAQLGIARLTASGGAEYGVSGAAATELDPE